MARRRAAVADLAREADLDIDEALLILWEQGFERVTGPGDFLSKGDANRARRALGLATRRELSSTQQWEEVFQLGREELIGLLQSLGVPAPFSGGRLTKRAIHRLRAELRTREPRSDLPLTEHLLAGPPEAPPSLVWETIGHARACRLLTAEQLMRIHFALVEDFAGTSDPIEPAGVRSDDLLGSAVHRPSTVIDGIEKYPTVEMAAAALLHGIVHNHPFHNGNKRTGLVAMLVFLDENGLTLTCEEDELFKLVLRLAQHSLVRARRRDLADSEVLEVAAWLRGRSRLVAKGDRPLKWHKLKRVLASHGCTFSFPAVGNKINISRTVLMQTIFGREKLALSVQVGYRDDGSDSERSTIHMIRRELRLDDEHGVDSAAFYDDEGMSASEFIVRYRKILRRLAHM
jgi:death-on-curing family protein